MTYSLLSVCCGRTGQKRRERRTKEEIPVSSLPIYPPELSMVWGVDVGSRAGYLENSPRHAWEQNKNMMLILSCPGKTMSLRSASQWARAVPKLTPAW